MNPFDAITNALNFAKGNRTRIFNIAAAVAAAFYGEAAVNAIQSFGLSTDEAITALISFVAAVNVLLRQFTNTAPGKRS